MDEPRCVGDALAVGGEVVLMAVEWEPQAAQSYVPTRGDASGEERLKVG